MQRIQRLIFLSICLIGISLTSSAKKEEMKLILFKGDSFTYLISQENSLQDGSVQSKMLHRMSLKITHKVVERLPTGNYLMAATFDSFATQFENNGRKYRYNSDTVDVRNKMYKVLLFMTDIKISYEVSPEGVVSKLTGFEPIKNRMDGDPFLKSMLWSFGNDQFLLEFFNYLPLKNVGVGSKWTNIGHMPEFKNFKYDIQHTLKEASEKELKLGHEALFNYTTEMQENDSTVNHITQIVNQKGTLSINSRNHMPISSDITQSIELSAYQKRSQVKKLNPAILTTTTKMIKVKK